MNIFIADDYLQLSQLAAEDLILLTKEKSKPLVCTASGDTPAGLYKILVEKVKNKETDISDWYFLGLDEWAGMNGEDEGSCRFHLNNQLFHPLQIPDEKIIFFNGKAKDLNKECRNVENFIQQKKRIDIAILGLGLNGHAGMNEPGTAALLRSHVTTLDPLTIKTGQKYFSKPQQLGKGITLGLATLLEAEFIFLLVSGAHKAAIAKQVLEGQVSENVPASLLRNHPGLRIYLDKESAQKLESN